MMAKINITKVQHQVESENTTTSETKGTTKKVSRSERYNKYVYPIIYCHTHDISRNPTHVSMNYNFQSNTRKKKKQPFST